MGDLGSRIQQSVQSRIQGGARPGVAPGNPTGQGGPPPGPGGIPGGPAPGNPGGPGNPTGPGTSDGTLGSYGNQSVDQWDSAFVSAGNNHGVDPRVLKAMMEIESGGNGNMSLDQCRDDGYGDGGSCGPMQIKPNIWGQSSSVEDQIDKAAKILGDYKAQHPGATDKDALMAVYFPSDDPNGTTQGSYGAKVDQLVGQMGDIQPGRQVTPAGDPSVGQLPNTGTGTSIQDGNISPATPPDAVILPPGKGQANTNDPVGMAVADLADEYIGTAYVWGGGNGNPTPGNWDCSGFVYYLSQHAGGNVPSTGSHEQMQWAVSNNQLKTDPSQVQPGDMLFFDTQGGGECRAGNCASHVAVYIGNGRMIHASHECTAGETQGVDCGVIESDFNHYLQMYQFLGSAATYEA